ncbi:MAG: RES family NAD+ phosphorylase [Thiohalomonadales bacterium]
MWTPTALKSESHLLKGIVWRVVEHQHTVSTWKIVDNLDEHEILEEIIDESKPIYPANTESLHYLLKTPFRYFPARPHGSRFRKPMEVDGVYYASEAIRTALAEMAYYRVTFFLAAPTSILPVEAQKLTSFTASYHCASAIDLTTSAFQKNSELWQANDYSGTQALAKVAREAGITAIRYQSVRDAKKGRNVALLNPHCFSVNTIANQQVWYMVIKEKEVYASRADTIRADEMYTFERTS